MMLAMKRAFVREGSGVVSGLVPADHIPDALTVGTAVTFRTAVAYAPYTTFDAGERGRVVSHCDKTGAVELKLAREHPGLSLWCNCLLLVPFDTDDILPAINCLTGNLFRREALDAIMALVA